MVYGWRRHQAAEDSSGHFPNGEVEVGTHVLLNGHVSSADGTESRGTDARKQQGEAALVGEDSIPKLADVVISTTLIGLRRYNMSRYILVEHLPDNVVCTRHALYISLVTLELIQIKLRRSPLRS